MRVSTTITNTKDKMVMAKTQTVTTASNIQPPQRSKTTVSPQSAPSIFAQKNNTSQLIHQRYTKESSKRLNK